MSSSRARLILCWAFLLWATFNVVAAARDGDCFAYIVFPDGRCSVGWKHADRIYAFGDHPDVGELTQEDGTP